MCRLEACRDAIGRSILGETLYNTIFGGAKKQKAELKKMGIVTDEGGTADDMEIELKKLQEQMKTMSTNQLVGLADTLTKVQANVGVGADIEDFDKIMKALESQAKITAQKEAEVAESTNGAVETKSGIITSNQARGAIIVDKPSYLPSSGTVIGESPTWSGKGMAGGGVSSCLLYTSDAADE